MGVIYKITSPTNKLYVGKTYDLRKRINCHKHCAKKGSNIILHNSIRKYGWENHVLEVIEEVPDEQLNEREMFWIAELKTYCYDYPGQMNMTKGGEGQRSTWMHKTEQRKKQSERFTGKGNPFYGKNHSKEFLERKAKEVSEYNKKHGIVVPQWGAEKGRLEVIKPVLLYDKNGDFLKEFESYTDGGNFIGVKASRVWESISGRKSQCSGFHFREKTENYPIKIDVSGTKQQTVKRPIYWLSEDLEPICEFPSALEASEFFGIPKTTINRAAMYNDLNPIRTGHIFIYKDQYLKEYCLTA